MHKFLVRSRESGVWSKKFGTRCSFLRTPNPKPRTDRWLMVVVLCALILAGCVRFTGGAGYSKVNSQGETTTKKVGFDTADYLPGSPPPGNITTS